MRDKKLRREAMVKRYILQQLLEHAANIEDIDRQAQHIEETLPSVPSARNVNRVHQRRPQKTKNKQRPKPAHDDKKDNTCQFCGIVHKCPQSQCPAFGKICGACSQRIISLACVKAKRNQGMYSINSNSQPSVFSRRNRRTLQTLILHFSSEQTSQTRPPMLLSSFVSMG